MEQTLTPHPSTPRMPTFAAQATHPPSAPPPLAPYTRVGGSCHLGGHKPAPPPAPAVFLLVKPLLSLGGAVLVQGYPTYWGLRGCVPQRLTHTRGTERASPGPQGLGRGCGTSEAQSSPETPRAGLQVNENGRSRWEEQGTPGWRESQRRPPRPARLPPTWPLLLISAPAGSCSLGQD